MENQINEQAEIGTQPEKEGQAPKKPKDIHTEIEGCHIMIYWDIKEDGKLRLNFSALGDIEENLTLDVCCWDAPKLQKEWGDNEEMLLFLVRNIFLTLKKACRFKYFPIEGEGLGQDGCEYQVLGRWVDQERGDDSLQLHYELQEFPEDISMK